jgi:replicative DNA helicase
MNEIAQDGKPIDFVTITECLGQHKEIEAVGGVAYVTSLTDGLPRVKNIKQYVDIVISLYQRRKFIQLTASALEEAYDNSGSIGDLIAKTEKSFLSIGIKGKSEPKHISEVIPRADAQVKAEEKSRMERGLVGRRTGLKKLDEFTTGYRNREVTVIAGETSDGKTCLMKQGIIASVFDGTKILVFSREVSDVSLTLDFKAYASGVRGKRIREGSMDLIDRQRFHDCNEQVKQWPVWIDDSRDLHIDDLVSKSRRWIREQRKSVEDELMVCMDYAQLMRGNGRNRTEEMEDICAGLWGLADAEHIPVIVLSQLNYPEDRKDKKPRPSLRRLKGASRIEQDAHTLIFVYQPLNDNGERWPEKSEIIVAKQRHGPTGTLYVAFDTETLMFTERY